MFVPGILGFQTFFYVFLLVVFLVIRHKLKNGTEKKEEMTGLMHMASEETTMAEFEASAEYSSMTVARGYQCAVCYCPTTMRCSKCKAVRYCSGKCQIIHWRQGHKDDCCPPVTTVQLKEESDFVGLAESQTQSVSYDTKGTHSSIASPSFSPSSVARKSFVNDSCHRLVNPISNNISGDTTPRVNKAELTTLLPLESTNFVNRDIKLSRSSKRNRTISSQAGKDNAFKAQSLENETTTSHDMSANVGINEVTRGVALEKSVTDDSKCRNSVSMSCSSPHSQVNDAEEESQLYKRKEGRSSSFGASDCMPSATRKDYPHPKSVKSGGILAVPHNVRNGLKTSAWKVVQQFKSSKESKTNLLTHRNEMGFPYELFVELYCYDKVKLCPFGLTNCGNSCYANAVLQCLTYTRPLTSYLLQGLHSRTCRKKGWCFICEFECLINKAKEGYSPLSPISILSKLHKIGSHLGQGREEDAHEFLRCAVDTLQSACLKEAGSVGPFAEETTLVGQTFGGYLRSKIKCLKCLGKSERYERMMDLTVEIGGDIGTLEEALAQFTAPEILEKDNKYNCSRCNSYEKARKKLTVLEAPNILTIVLKRFQSGNFEKLNKSVQFPEALNMAPFMSGTRDKSPLYRLYAVVVHLDIVNAAFSGHYVCYVKNLQGEWFRIDDSRVEPVELQRVLLERAYMLLYARCSPKSPALVNSNANPCPAKSKRRNLEAVPSSLATSKTSTNSIASAGSSAIRQKHAKYPHWDTVDGPFNTELSYPEEWRFHLRERIPSVDSLSESSSLFSWSDASSCSTASTKDSASNPDFSDYIFGEMGSNW